MELSIVIPAYNEEKRLPRCLSEIAEFASSSKTGCEVLIVDDGSRDNTAKLAERWVRTSRRAGIACRLLRHQSNMGKGAAVRTGVEAARGRIILFTDVDLAAPVSEFNGVVQAVKDGADVAVGVRKGIARKPIRRVAATLFQVYVRAMLHLQTGDTQCGLKVFRSGVGKRLFGISSCNGYAFDVEILALASQLGYRIASVPVKWTEMPGSKVNVLSQGLRMAREVTDIRKRVRMVDLSTISEPAPKSYGVSE